MADKKKNQSTKQIQKRGQSAKKPVNQVKDKSSKPATTKLSAKKSLAKSIGKSTEIAGFSARIKLPNGKIMVASESGLRDAKTGPSTIIIKSREQAQLVAKNLATAYGKGAKPSVSVVKK